MIKNLLNHQTLTIDALLSSSATPFIASDARILSFIEAMSAMLLNDPACRQSPELVALGFWLRKGNIAAMIASPAEASLLRRPLGTVVHYTPANVDTMFVYSWICALLMGNHNIVRVSGRESEIQNTLLSVIAALFALPEHAVVAAANHFIHFPRDDEAGHAVSLMADARVLWGGDESVNSIRQLPCKPRCRDISFADRFSAAVIDVNGVSDFTAVAGGLWRECDMFQQQACSSPRILFWTGLDDGWHHFVKAMDEQAKPKVPTMMQRNEQLVLAQWCMADGLVSHSEQCGALSLLHVKQWDSTLLARHNGHGSLFCIRLPSLTSLTDYDHPRWQTLSYAGFEPASLFKILQAAPIQGIDRVVPVGKALTFSPDWDGYALFSQLSRQVVFE